jgi:hypothetical protein
MDFNTNTPNPYNETWLADLPNGTHMVDIYLGSQRCNPNGTTADYHYSFSIDYAPVQYDINTDGGYQPSIVPAESTSTATTTIAQPTSTLSNASSTTIYGATSTSPTIGTLNVIESSDFSDDMDIASETCNEAESSGCLPTNIGEFTITASVAPVTFNQINIDLISTDPNIGTQNSRIGGLWLMRTGRLNGVMLNDGVTGTTEFANTQINPSAMTTFSGQDYTLGIGQSLTIDVMAGLITEADADAMMNIPAEQNIPHFSYSTSTETVEATIPAGGINGTGSFSQPIAPTPPASGPQITF